MKVLELEIEKIKPYQQNAKLHDEKQIENVATSIKKYGFQQPLVVSKDYELIIGHCRLLASKALGLKTVPVVIADKLTDEQVKELRLIDNKTNESEWDFDFLSLELEDLDLTDFDIDWGVIKPEDFGEDFELPNEDHPQSRTITLTLNEEQFAICENVIEEYSGNHPHDFGNHNDRSNAIFEAIYLWAEQKNLL